MVTDVVRSAAEVLLPFLGAGGGAVAGSVMEELGADLYHRALDTLNKVRHLIKRPDVPSIEAGLQRALEQHLITSEDLRQLVEGAQVKGGAIFIGRVVAKNSITGTHINITTFNG